MKTLLLFDFNNLAHRCVHIKQITPSATNDTWSLLSYMIFHIMYDFIMEVSEYLEEDDTVDVVLAIDSHDGYWRRDIYPPYKADRAKRRSQDEIDWQRAYEEFNKLLDVLAKHTPWKVLRVSKCEADDVIYTLATANTDGSTIIHSGDSDYLQLVSDDISLYSVHNKDYVEFPYTCKVADTEVRCSTPAEYLQYAILTGQGGKDNVYNVKTPTDWDAAAGKRKPGFGVAAARKLLTSGRSIEEATKDAGLWENYCRNKTLIDMTELPTEYRERILSAYTQYETKSADIHGLLAYYDRPSVRGNADDISARMDMIVSGVKGMDDGDTSIAYRVYRDSIEFTI